MKISSKFVLAILFALLVLLKVSLPVDMAFAHAMRAEILSNPDSNVAIALFNYSDGTAASFSKVEVYSPLDGKIEFQNGRTDRKGIFAFVPDSSGEWRMVAADSMGHRVEMKIDIEGISAAPIATDINSMNSSINITAIEKKIAPQPTGKGTKELWDTPLKAISGISLIFNMWIFMFWLKRHSRRKGYSGE